MADATHIPGMMPVGAHSGAPLLGPTAVGSDRAMPSCGRAAPVVLIVVDDDITSDIIEQGLREGVVVDVLGGRPAADDIVLLGVAL